MSVLDYTRKHCKVTREREKPSKTQAKFITRADNRKPESLARTHVFREAHASLWPET